MATFTTAENVCEIKLSHDEVQEIAGDLAAAGRIATAVGQPWAGAILAAIGGILVTVDGIGLNNGVNVVGVFQTQLVTVTPEFISPVEMFASFSHALMEATGLPGGVVGAGIGAGVAMLAVGPAGVVVGGVLGWLGGPDDDGPHPGDVHADRRAIGPWEKFLLVPVTIELEHPALGRAHRRVPRVAFGSWRGYFSAEDGGGNQVHANRREIGPWESSQLIHNPERHRQRARLKTFSQGTYVSVQ